MKSNPRARGRRAIEPTPKRRTRGGSSPKPAPRKKPAACPRVPICLLDAVRAGRPVRVVAKGQRWAVVEEGVAKPLAQRKHQDAAEQLVQVAYADLERELQLACPPATTASDSALVFTPQRPQGEPVHYAVLEAADVVSSHDPMTFGPDSRYPTDVQERVYHRDPNEQRKVQVGAQTLQPAIVLNRAPTPEAGPPLVTAGDRAIVLGGNGRSMMIRRAYAERLASAKAYRADLTQRAGEFGIDPATVQAMEAPILVRVVEGLSPASDPKELAAAVRRYNETMTAALDAKAAAVAKARQLSHESIEEIGRILSEGGDKTLRKLMADEPAAFLRVLENDGILTRENRAEYTQAGALTDRAKDELEGMFLGRVLGTADRLSATSAAIANKVERAAPFLLRVEGVNPQFSRIATMQAAVDLANESKARKLELEELLAQEGMFDKRRTDAAAEELARILLEDGPRKVADRFRRWADVAARDTTQSGFALFTEPPPTADDANAALFRRLENPCAWEYRRPNPSIVCPRCKGTGKSAPWATQEGRKAFDVCPLCAGRGVLVVDQLARATPAQPRLFNPCKPGSELRVVIESAGKDQHGVALYRPCLARVEGTKVREVFQCGDTTKTAIETAFDAAKRLGRQLNVAVDIGGVLLEPPNKRTPNPSPRRLRPVLYSEAKTTRELARELVLGLGRLLAGSVRVVRAKGQPLTILLEGTRVAAVLLGSKRREKAFVEELDADVQRARRRVRALHSQEEVPPMQPHTPEQTRESVEPADDRGELHPTARKGRAMREQLEREHDLPANAIIAINVETGEWNLSEDPTDLGPSLKLREKDPKAPIYIGRVGGGPVFRLPSRR